jgi:molybdate transport system ATP-binding protein
LLDRKPERLSGGERQRVGIARALAVSPRILLMDEPLAALDVKRKQEILPYLERLHDELEIPVLYVSHAPDEVARLADHLVVMEGGRVLADGPLTETLARQHPGHSSIQNVLEGQVDAITDDEHPGLALVRVRIGTSSLVALLTKRAVASIEVSPGQDVWVQVKSVALME